VAVVQRATAAQREAATRLADEDFKAGRTDRYFAGNFLANHLEKADESLASAKGGAGAMFKDEKSARSQSFRKAAERAHVEGGGTGYGPRQRSSGTNTVILDFGHQMLMLMRAVNKAQIDHLAVRPNVGYFEFVSDDTFRAATYGSDGKRSVHKGRAHLGAVHDLVHDRYGINHLGRFT